jgi:hypothetical protein
MQHPIKQRIRDGLTKAVSEAMRRLLSEKHLYQCVEVDKKPLVAMANLSPDDLIIEGYMAKGDKVIIDPASWIATGLSIPWLISGCNIHGSMADIVLFQMPSINTFCSTCDDRQPFNPVEPMSTSFLRVEHDENFDQDQTYHLGYECQQCHKTFVRLLVRRDKLKLRLCGRDPIEAIPAPKELPKALNKFYSDAQIAHHAGQTLAGIFLLRTFIEQFWRSMPVVQAVIKAQPRATGDEQGSAYQGTLPTDFKGRFPSLSEIYAKLSAAMHDANADAALFEDSCAKTLEHFEARRLFKI